MFDYISHSVPMEKFHDLGKQNRISIIFCMAIYLKYNIIYKTLGTGEMMLYWE